MNLTDYATNELELAGLLDNDSDYGGMLGRAVLEIVDTFSKQGHSGSSALAAIDLVSKLLQYQPLTPLTYEDHEWMKHDEKTWQHRRKFSIFSDDQGDSWYDLDEKPQVRHWIIELEKS